MRPFFISGIGTGIGKTLVAALLSEALHADYWKPVQAGMEPDTDSRWLKSMISNSKTVIHPELYKLKLPASPHIAARQESNRIDLERIHANYLKMDNTRPLIIEGAGGLLVPLNEKEFVSDLVKKLDARLILVSRNYLGSINHSLMTAHCCRSLGLDVAGWIFNDQYLDYEQEIVSWSGYPSLLSLPRFNELSKPVIHQAAREIEKIIRSAIPEVKGHPGE